MPVAYSGTLRHILSCLTIAILISKLIPEVFMVMCFFFSVFSGHVSTSFQNGVSDTLCRDKTDKYPRRLGGYSLPGYVPFLIKPGLPVFAMQKAHIRRALENTFSPCLLKYGPPSCTCYCSVPTCMALQGFQEKCFLKYYT